MFKQKISLKYLSKNISIIIGLVLIWRSIWYVLDEFDKWIFGGSHIWTALGGHFYWSYYFVFARQGFKRD